MISNPYQQYQRNSIMTASKEELTLMLYNGAIKFCNQGIEAIENKDIQKAHESIIKAQNIINELDVTLDKNFDYATEISQLYRFIHQLLVEANMEKNKEKLQQANQLIREFKNTWEQVIQKVRKRKYVIKMKEDII